MKLINKYAIRPSLVRRHRGMTLIEVTLAMALTALMCIALIAVGVKAKRFSEHNRLAGEARSLGRERLEEMIAIGMANLAQPSCTLRNHDTNMSSLGRAIIREPRLFWHAADGSITVASSALYAEVHLDVLYTTPLLRGEVTDTYSTIVH
jgi:type II secretory pathway pseudopilin PulG